MVEKSRYKKFVTVKEKTQDVMFNLIVEGKIAFHLNNTDTIHSNLFLASAKLEINGSTLVLEKDGTEVSDDDVLLYFKEETLILLQPGETWKSPISDETESTK